MNVNIQKALLADRIRLFHESLDSIKGDFEVNNGNLSFSDEWSTKTGKFDQNEVIINDLTINDLWQTNGTTTYDNGVLTFNDLGQQIKLSDIVKDVDFFNEISKINSYGTIYDIQSKDVTFTKYQNVKICLGSDVGYYSIDKLLNDERSRKLYLDEKSDRYTGTEVEFQNQPYSGILDDPSYQADGWMDLDYIIYRYFGDAKYYDNEASFSLRSKPVKNAKRVIIDVLLQYVSDIYSLRSYNKTSEFSVRLIDKSTGQVFDLSTFKNDNELGIGSVITAIYNGNIEYDVGDHIVEPSHSLNLNKCGKVYINKCDGSLFTMEDYIRPNDEECEDCRSHDFVVQVRVNPSAFLRITKPDILNTIDPIHWTRGLNDNSEIYFKDIIQEFGKQSYIVGKLNRERAFAQADGEFLKGYIAGGLSTDTVEFWNGTSWRTTNIAGIDARMPVQQSFGIGGGNGDKIATFYGATASSLGATSLHINHAFIFDGLNWLTSTPYTLPSPSLRRHSNAGFVKVEGNEPKTGVDFYNLLHDKFKTGTDQTTEESIEMDGISFCGTSANFIGFETPSPYTNFYNFNFNNVHDDFEYFSFKKNTKYKTTTKKQPQATTATFKGTPSQFTAPNQSQTNPNAGLTENIVGGVNDLMGGIIDVGSGLIDVTTGLVGGAIELGLGLGGAVVDQAGRIVNSAAGAVTDIVQSGINSFSKPFRKLRFNFVKSLGKTIKSVATTGLDIVGGALNVAGMVVNTGLGVVSGLTGGALDPLLNIAGGVVNLGLGTVNNLLNDPFGTLGDLLQNPFGLIEGLLGVGGTANLPPEIQEAINNVIINYGDDWEEDKEPRELLQEQESPEDGDISVTEKAHGCWLIDVTKKYPVKAFGIKYVGSVDAGLSTGGRGYSQVSTVDCGGMGEEKKTIFSKSYLRSDEYDEFNVPIYNLAYEYNGTSWSRRDNLPEEVYYHTGVGDQNNSVFWGGVHASIEVPSVNHTIPSVYENWKDVVEDFKGTFHRNGTFGLDGEIRYTLFPTLYKDKDNNTYYQIGDIRDYVNSNKLSPNYKPILGTDSNAYEFSEEEIEKINNIKANPHHITVSKRLEDEIQVSTYFNGEAWNVRRLLSGLGKKRRALLELQDGIGLFCKTSSENTAKLTVNITPEGDSIQTNHFAPRINLLSNLEFSYSGHTVKGGTWIWSRPTIGEYLFHPEHYVRSDGQPRDLCDYISRSFTPAPSAISCSVSGDPLSFYLPKTGTSISGKGLQQFVYSEKVSDNVFAFVERWEQPFDTELSSISDYSINIRGETIAVSSLQEKHNSSLSYGEFDRPLQEMLDSGLLTSIILHQFENEENPIISGGFVYDMSEMINWLQTPTYENFHIKGYDDFNIYFEESNLLSVKPQIRSSSVKDRSHLFPWVDLLKGNPTNRCVEGDTTWNWVRLGEAVLLMAEVTFARVVDKDEYFERTGRNVDTSTYPDKIWHEEIKFTSYNKFGEELWNYTVYYDEVNAESFTGGSIVPEKGTLFGVGVRSRQFDDYSNEDKTGSLSFNSPTEVFTTLRRWNALTIGHRDERVSDREDEERHILYLDWRRTRDSIPLTDFTASQLGTLYDVVNEGSLPNNGRLYKGSDSEVYPWTVPFDGQVISQSFMIDSPLSLSGKTEEIVDNELLDDLFDIIIDAPQDTTPKAKEIVSVYPYSGKYRVTRAVIGLPESNGYIYDNFGKSSLSNFDSNFAPIDVEKYQQVTINQQSNSKYLFPWIYLHKDPTAYVEMTDGEQVWMAIGNPNNKKFRSPIETHKNVYYIIKINKQEYEKLPFVSELVKASNQTLSLYNDGIDLKGKNIIGERITPSLYEAIFNQMGEQVYDLFITIFEDIQDENPITGLTQNTSIYSSYNLPYNTFTGSLQLNLVQDIKITPANNLSCVDCKIEQELKGTSWVHHVREEWTTPFLESPFTGFLANDGFNVWLSVNKPKWGTPLWIDFDVTGDLVVNFRSQRVGVDYDETRTDKSRNKVYVSNLRTSMTVQDFNNCRESNNTAIPCTVVFDEYVFDYEDYKDHEIVRRIVGQATDCYVSDLSKEKGYNCVDPLVALVNYNRNLDVDSTEEDKIDFYKKLFSIPKDYHYTEWATNFIQEYKGRVNQEGDNEIKYFFKYDRNIPFGSSASFFLDHTNKLDLVETDWRRYQDGVGLGGYSPVINFDGCSPVGFFKLGQSAFGNPNKAIIVGGFDIFNSISNCGETNLFNNVSSETFKWNKTVINPEDTLNDNYSKRTIVPLSSNNEITNAKSSIKYVMFDIGKNTIVERRGTVEFVNTDTVEVEFDRDIQDLFINNTGYSVVMTPSENVKLWWEEKTNSGFIIKSELSWSGKVDWCIMLEETIETEKVEGIISDEQQTFDYFDDL